MSNVSPSASVLLMPVAGVHPDGEISSPSDASDSQSPATDASGADSFILAAPVSPSPTATPSSSPDPDKLRQPYTRVYIDGIIPSLPAERAGLKENDVVLSINGHPISTRDELIALIQQHRDGLTARILRNGQELDIRLVPEFQASTGRILIGINPIDIVTTYDEYGEPFRYMHDVRDLRDIDGNVLCTRSMKLSPGSIQMGDNDKRSRSVDDYILLYDQAGRTKEFDLMRRFNTKHVSVYSWTERSEEKKDAEGWFERSSWSGKLFIPRPGAEPIPHDIHVFLHELAHAEQRNDPLFDSLEKPYATCKEIEGLIIGARSTFGRWRETDRSILVDGLRKSYAQIVEKIYHLSRKLPREYSPDDIFRLKVRMEGFFVHAGRADADIGDLSRAAWALEREVGSFLRPVHIMEWHADMVALRNLRTIREEIGINLFAPYKDNRLSSIANQLLGFVQSGQAPGGIDSILADPLKYGIRFHPLQIKRIKEGFDRGASNGRISVPWTVIDAVQLRLAGLGMKGPLVGAEKYLQGLPK
ncbi:MAG: PDZ domain-containing protein [Candidatus Peribacteraceae bacterium]